jgi:hypothetical protein
LLIVESGPGFPKSINNQSAISNQHSAIKNLMRLYVSTMDAVVVEVSSDGRVRLENEDWSTPTLQERRAIIHAAQEELSALSELLDILGS